MLTGTPWHSRPVFPGDTVEVEVEGVGRLTNTVVEGPGPDDGRGFPATVTKTSLAVALGSDYRRPRSEGIAPSPEVYEARRQDLIASNMASGPTPPPPRP